MKRKETSRNRENSYRKERSKEFRAGEESEKCCLLNSFRQTMEPNFHLESREL